MESGEWKARKGTRSLIVGDFRIGWRFNMKRDFTLEYWMDKGWYVGHLKDVPGVFSQGETMDELIRNIEEVYHLMLDDSLPHIQEKTMTVQIGLEL